MTDTSLPAPLVPAEVDLRDFQGMWVDTDRLLRSDTWLEGSGDQKAAAFTLWAESWHQVPAASLPTNDRLLGKLSQADAWARCKAHALRGWVECSDGRLYHPVVAEKALEAWVEKLTSAISGAVGNAKRWQIEIDTQQIRQQLRTAVDALRNLAPTSRALKKKAVIVILADSPPDQRSDSGGDTRSDSPPDAQIGSPPESGKDRKGPDPTGPDPTGTDQTFNGDNHPYPAQGAGTAYGAITRQLRQAGMARVNPGELRFRALVDAGATAEEFLAYIDRAMDKDDPFAWLVGAIEGERKRAAKTAEQLHRGPMPAATDRKSRQLETAALMTGSAPRRATSTTEPETIDVTSRVIAS